MDITDAMLADLQKGRRGTVAKAITIVENDPAGARRLVRRIFADTGTSAVIGITGPAGAGKSSLIDRTVIALNKMGAKPAVLAVDPTSHITGGAILGDRVRMAESADSGTYIRSIASRGATGAVSASLRNSIRVLEYAGFDPIIIESVGAGQTEVEISKIADITVVVFSPHTGDSIQAIKAGLTEIGDVYLVNKCDLAGADRLYDAVRDFIGDRESGGPGGPGAGAGGESRGRDDDNDNYDDGNDNGNDDGNDDDGNAAAKKPTLTVPVIKTSVKRAPTVRKFAKTLLEMAAASKEGRTDGQRRLRLDAELRDMVASNLRDRLDHLLDTDRAAARHLDRLVSGKSDPFAAADKITRSLLG